MPSSPVASVPLPGSEESSHTLFTLESTLSTTQTHKSAGMQREHLLDSLPKLLLSLKPKPLVPHLQRRLILILSSFHGSYGASGPVSPHASPSQSSASSAAFRCTLSSPSWEESLDVVLAAQIFSGSFSVPFGDGLLWDRLAHVTLCQPS